MDEEEHGKQESAVSHTENEGDNVSQEAMPIVAGANMTQLAVFLGGLVFTIIVYFALSILVQNISTEKSQSINVDSQRSISARLSGIEDTIKAASVIVSLSAGMNEKDLSDRVLYGVPGADKFNDLFLMYKGSRGWHTRTLVNSDGASTRSLNIPYLSRGNEKKLYDYIVTSRTHAYDDVVVVSDILSEKDYKQLQAEPVIKGRVLLIAKTLKIGDMDGVIVGIAHTAKIFDAAWVSEKRDLGLVSMRDINTGRPIYYMDKDFKGEERFNLDLKRMEMIVSVGNAGWELQLEVGHGREFLILKVLPLFALFFGIAITFVATVYVRNDQKQSYRFLAVNRALAQKKHEMNSQAAERERLNKTLRRAEREYKAIIDSVSDIIFETDTKGEIMFLNDSWERITGFLQPQSVGRSLFDLIHPQDQDAQRQNFDQMVKGKRNRYHFVTRLRTSEGMFRAVEVSISMLRQDESRNLRIVGTITDIEERRRAERALGEAEKKYRTIVENVAGGIYQVTPEGQFLSANPAMASTFGFDTPEQMLQEVKNAHTSLYVNSRERAQFLHKLETMNIVKNFETQIQTKDGQKIWISESGRAVKDDDGNVLYFEGSVENVSRRKEIELKLREAKIQSDLASRAKSEFLANMSHELRTPLNAIIGFAEIIRNEVLGSLGNPQYKEYISDIYDSGKRLLAIINEILDVSRIETGDRQLNEGIVDISGTSKFCLEFMKPKADAANLVMINLMEGRVPKIVGEELAIKQIFLNLLSNAVKYTANGGRITLSHELDNEGQLRISITDTGVGLDDSEIEKALSPFGQVEVDFNRAGSGAGLGLTLVDSLVKLHGGRLELFSQKGIGTTATVVFPARRVAHDQKEEEKQGGATDEDGAHDGDGKHGDDDTNANRNLQ